MERRWTISEIKGCLSKNGLPVKQKTSRLRVHR